eukprot:scaffold67816_cov16-Tisochrysis_lutea.AAC.1
MAAEGTFGTKPKASPCRTQTVEQCCHSVRPHTAAGINSNGTSMSVGLTRWDDSHAGHMVATAWAQLQRG